MLCAVIMAGGKGTRFWPKSTEEMPKQFINLIDDKTMIQLTYERLLKIIPKERIFVVTGEKYKDLVSTQLSDLPNQNIIVEPVGRNTAPCILLASMYINQIFEDANVAVLPSDHAIGNKDEFCKTLMCANDYVENKNKKAIVTIGITPNRPETGYGYIKFNKSDDKVIKIDRFVEKPNLDNAKKYLDEGNYLWNAGMFIFNIKNMLKELEENYSGYKILEKLPKIEDKNYKEALEKLYPDCEAISIDYAVMEKSNNIYVIPSDFGWDDIGTWMSLTRYIKADEQNNYLKGDIVSYNSKNNIVYAGNKKVILLDIDNVFCIDADGVIVIGSRDKIKDVHELRNK